jgi:hypothetical protein
MAKKNKKGPAPAKRGNMMLILGSLAVIAFAVGWMYSDAEPGQDGEAIQMTMYKSPSCACCDKWVAHLERNGFVVETIKYQKMYEIKEREGLTAQTASCHTAFVDGYVVEGHVPARDIKRMLSERPQVKGLTVPGMPMGSPGMEGDYRDSYDVLTYDLQGNTEVYSSY